MASSSSTCIININIHINMHYQHASSTVSTSNIHHQQHALHHRHALSKSILNNINHATTNNNMQQYTTICNNIQQHTKKKKNKQQSTTEGNENMMTCILHHFITLSSGILSWTTAAHRQRIDRQPTSVTKQMKTTNNNQPLSGDQYDHISSMLYLGQCYNCRPKCNLTQFVLIYIQQSNKIEQTTINHWG